VNREDHALHATWKVVPARSGRPLGLEHRAQLDWSYDLLSIGLRFAYARVSRRRSAAATTADFEAGAALASTVW